MHPSMWLEGCNPAAAPCLPRTANAAGATQTHCARMYGACPCPAEPAHLTGRLKTPCDMPHVRRFLPANTSSRVVGRPRRCTMTRPCGNPGQAGRFEAATSGVNGTRPVMLMERPQCKLWATAPQPHRPARSARRRRGRLCTPCHLHIPRARLPQVIFPLDDSTVEGNLLREVAAAVVGDVRLAGVCARSVGRGRARGCSGVPRLRGQRPRVLAVGTMPCAACCAPCFAAVGTMPARAARFCDHPACRSPGGTRPYRGCTQRDNAATRGLPPGSAWRA